MSASGYLRDRAMVELWAFRNVFRTHAANSNAEKIGFWLLAITWSIIEIGTTFTAATPPTSMWWIRVLFVLILGRMWGIESALIEHGLAPLPPTSRPGGRGGSGGDPPRGARRTHKDGRGNPGNTESDGGTKQDTEDT